MSLHSNKKHKEEMLRFRAEDMVLDSMRSTPEFKSAVTKAMGELKKVEKSAAEPIFGVPRPGHNSDHKKPHKDK